MSQKRKNSGPKAGKKTKQKTRDSEAVNTYESVAAVEMPAAATPAEGPAQDTENGAEQGPDLASTVAELQRKAEEHWDALLRTRAEMENLRKRAARDVEQARKYALERFVDRLLPVKDSLEAGLGHDAAEDASGRLREGMELTLKMFNNMLNDNAICEINPVDERFDPELHEAMTTQPSSDHQANTVLEVLQKGYMLNGRLVRPARVIVAADAG